MLANHKTQWVYVDGLASPVEVKPGSFITGRYSFHRAMFPKPTNSIPAPLTVWRWLQGLESLQNVNIKTNNKYSLITIVNWDIYQSCENDNEQQNEQNLNSRRTTDEHQMNTNKNDKNVKNKISSASKKTDADHEDFYLTKKKRKLTGKRLVAFNMFWKAFNYPKGKAEAADAWIDIKYMTSAIVQQIIAAAIKEAENRPSDLSANKIPKMAQGWLSGRRWEDEDLSKKEERCEL